MADMDSLPLDSIFNLMIIPIIFVVVIRETRMYLTFLAWMIIIVSIAIAGSYQSCLSVIIPIAVFGIIGIIIVADTYHHYILLFMSNRNLKETIDQNLRQAEQNKAIEMRHMIANVAHDLKTVSTHLLVIYIYSFSSDLISVAFFYRV
jgi:signal transduction histidine kinase